MNPAIIAGFSGHSVRMSAYVVDSIEFCRSGKQVSGVTPVAEFKRLCADLADLGGELRWSFQAGFHPEGDSQLLMEVAGTVKLICQRCMAPFDHSLQAQATLVLAADENAADEAEARLDDERIDVIVGTKTMDLLMLVEDEALLSLPLSPRHEVCPGPVTDVEKDKVESPFAVLKTLRS
ncbi:MAG: YceD family protein [Oxalobacteraceae bacterium]